MAIQKPYNINIYTGQAIPAEETYAIKWSVSGAVQTEYEISIEDNSDDTNVHSTSKVSSYSTEYDLPSSTLTNGGEFKLTITVYDENGNSATSEPIVFVTSARPVLTMDTIGTVANSSYNFSATYSQAESVPMSTYIAYLYNDNQTLINQSNIKTILPIEHLFTDLQSETSYYVEFHATSDKGLTGTTGMVQFDVLYTRPNLAVDLSAQNVSDAGIELSWYVTQIIGESDTSVTYVNGEEVDLTDGNKIYFDQNFSTDRDFQLGVWLSSPPVSSNYNELTFMTLKGDNDDKFLIQYWDDNTFRLWKEVNGVRSLWVSEPVTGTDFFVRIKQVKDNCEIYAETIA